MVAVYACAVATSIVRQSPCTARPMVSAAAACIDAVLQASKLLIDIWDSAGKVKTMDQLWQDRRAEVRDTMQANSCRL